MGTGLQTRVQVPAFEVHDIVARHNGFLNAGAPESTPRRQERVGAKLTPIQHSHALRGAIAGAHLPANPASNPSTRLASVQHSRVTSRDVIGSNYASRKGSGSGNHPKPIAGTDDIFNVGGSGGRSAILVKVPHAVNLKAHGTHVALRKAHGGASPKNDPTKAPLIPPSVPVHMGFNHVGYR